MVLRFIYVSVSVNHGWSVCESRADASVSRRLTCDAPAGRGSSTPSRLLTRLRLRLLAPHSGRLVEVAAPALRGTVPARTGTAGTAERRTARTAGTHLREQWTRDEDQVTRGIRLGLCGTEQRKVTVGLNSRQTQSQWD